MGKNVNNTKYFIDLINVVLEKNDSYFNSLRQLNLVERRKIILKKLDIPFQELEYNSYEWLKKYIREFILSEKENFNMDMQVIKNISKQIKIEYLLGNLSKEKAQFYYSITNALIEYGIYRDGKIISFENVNFWKKLIELIILLNMLNANNYDYCCDENFYNYSDFNQLPKLVEAKEFLENKLNEKINFIDGQVVFEKNQEERIIKKIEKKLSQVNLFYFLEYLFELYEQKKQYFDNIDIPFRYIVNILIKNIAFSKHKKKDDKKIVNIIELFRAFLMLYQLKTNKFENMFITENNIVQHLKKQVLFANFYPLYVLKTNTLIEYINNLIKSNIDEDIFFEKFGFKINDLINFLKLLDYQKNNVIYFEEDCYEKNILNFFAIDAKNVNKNFSTIKNLKHVKNLFFLNPIIKYKNKFYIIGFKYFKMNFYISIVEKIRKEFDKNINTKIGNSIDNFVEKIFSNIKKKYNYELFSGKYKLSKSNQLESDLVIKDKNDIIFIENKNKYLTNFSFSGIESFILKDIIFSFIHSQKQAFRHELNLRKYKQLEFDNGKCLTYENQNIIKITISTNNWFNIMNNIGRNLMLSLIRLRFDIKEDKEYDNKKDFIKANEYLDDINKIINELDKDYKEDINIILNQSLFIPLELIVDKYEDNNFFDCLKKLVGIKMNTDNIMYIYDCC